MPNMPLHPPRAERGRFGVTHVRLMPPSSASASIGSFCRSTPSEGLIPAKAPRPSRHNSSVTFVLRVV